MLFVGPLAGAQGEAFRTELEALRGAVQLADTSDGFDSLWPAVRAHLRAGRALLLVDLEPSSDGAYLDWLRGEVAQLAAAFPQAPPPQVTAAALGRRGLDARLVSAALDDGRQRLECRALGPVPEQPDWSAPPPHRRQVFLCTGPRCVRRGALPLWKTLRRELARRELIETAEGVLLTRTGCQFPCNRGPLLTVYPDRCWYGVRDEAQVLRVVEGHLQGGEPVAELLIEGAP
ncbi:(2Fe-2S) ferredoxin domain-containing protein [Pseudomonas citronellolis]|uniref:(2Fe-2S) ferredoxin domain-containing protein n=1 Tax=Pseudomonas citronellolis TaxID=53408 RepID=UPI0023E3A5B1|nr:(2Fe-2S) ferredoxin domain-containing protein [Pseudomonas citronellolis]MDF3932324.1 (2Fe-2S) ferredoxin domain-containing protein [Pseudomonas citronellolis]